MTGADEQTGDNANIITYGCSAHILNLLSSDVEVAGMKEHIVRVIKYFRNKQQPAFWYKQAGASKLCLLQEVRWNTLSDALTCYLKNRGFLVQVCQDHKDYIDSSVYRIVNDANISVNAQDYLKRMQPIAVALDRAQSQRSFTTISDCVEIWNQLGTDLENQPTSVRTAFNKRKNMALANMLDHRYLGRVLSDVKRSQAYDYLTSVNYDLVPIVMALQCGDNGDIFPKYMFKYTFTKVSPPTWWNIACKSITASDTDVQAKLINCSVQLQQLLD